MPLVQQYIVEVNIIYFDNIAIFGCAGHVTRFPRNLQISPRFGELQQLYRPASALIPARPRGRDVYPRPTRASSPIWTSAALLRGQVRPSRFLDISIVLPPKPPIMPSTATSLFSSTLGTSDLDIPDHLQRPNDFESTRTEPSREDEENTEVRLELDRLRGYELSRGKKKLRSFI
jgi:hypothetical protein